MSTTLPWVTVHGRPESPVERRSLRAGPVTALLDGVDLRFARVGGVEIVRRIYVAVRDRNWNTVPGEIADLSIEERDASFSATFVAQHRSSEVDFLWRGAIAGAPDGSLDLRMDGEIRRDMQYNRIGFCVLHPFRETAGRPYRAGTPDGELEGRFPLLIGPQRFEDGHYVGLFPPFDDLSVDLPEAGSVRFGLEGDLFETEDQRNFTDASFKSYTTPLTLGFPHAVRKGQSIRQRLRVVYDGTPPAFPSSSSASREPLRLTLGRPTDARLPSLGVGVAHDGEPLSEREAELLASLRLGHLRVDLHLAQPEVEAALRGAAEQAARVGCGLEVALHTLPEHERQLADLAGIVRELAAAPVRFLVLHEGAGTTSAEETTPGPLVSLVRRHLAPAAPNAAFAGGTDMYFTELNRTRPAVEAMDAIFYSIIPQVHAFDDLSLVETLEAQAETVRTARSFAEGRPVLVTPVTLRRRFNPHATAQETAPGDDALPDAVDHRQPTLLGAAWTCGSLKHLAESGAASVTYYETTGWRGVMERATGSPLPARFHSVPGMAFPLFHVLGDAGEWRGGQVVECTSSDPIAGAALAVETAGGSHVLAANLTPHPQRALIDGVPPGRVALRRLNHHTAASAGRDPGGFRATREDARADGELALDLAPYETVRIDVHGGA